MSEPFVVHQSGLKLWRRCRQAAHYALVEKIERRKPPSPLLRGTVVHSMIENFVSGKDPWKPFKDMEAEYSKLFIEQQEEYGDLPGEIKRIMTGYFEWYKQDPLKPVKFKGRYAEHKFSVPLLPGIVLEGKIDMVGDDKRNHRWLEDHKTHKQLPVGDLVYSDIQTALYGWVMPQIGLGTPYGVAWNYIRWKAPTIPEVLKSGALSKATRIDTTWDVYRQAIKDNGLKEKDYQDMKALLRGKENDFYARHYLPFKENSALLEGLLDDARRTAKEMKRKLGKDKTRNIERHCQWCQFYSLCQAELKGLDTKFVRRDYRKRKEDEQVQETE